MTDIKYLLVSNQRNTGYYVLAAMLVHILFFFFITHDFTRGIQYEELSMDLSQEQLPIIVAKPLQKIVKIKAPTPVNPPNNTIQIVEKNEKDQEEEEEVDEQPVVNEDSEDLPTDDAAVPQQEYVPFYSVDTRPTFVNKAVLQYPLKEKVQGKEGLVIIEVDLDEKGVPQDIRIIKSAGENFDKAAIQMIENSTFAPGYKHSRPIAVRMKFNVRFKLN